MPESIVAALDSAWRPCNLADAAHPTRASARGYLIR